MRNKSSKKVVVISGGAGYLGSSIRHLLEEKGFIVLALDKKTVDITVSEAVREAAKRIKTKYGVIEAVIHAASAKLIRKPLLTQSRRDFENQFSVNVSGAFNLFKYFVPLLSDRGTIIGITSGALDLGTNSPSGSYLPAKAALRGILNILRKELSEKSFRVFEVAPAFMPGGLNRDIPKAAIEFIQKRSKPEDTTTPEEISKKILEMIESG